MESKNYEETKKAMEELQQSDIAVAVANLFAKHEELFGKQNQQGGEGGKLDNK